MVLICKCKTEIPEGNKFCPNCGRKTPKPKEPTAPIDINAKLAFSIKEVAQVLSVSPTTVRNMIHQGALDYIPIGKRLVIPKGTIEKFVIQNTKCEQLSAVSQ